MIDEQGLYRILRETTPSGDTELTIDVSVFETVKEVIDDALQSPATIDFDSQKQICTASFSGETFTVTGRSMLAVDREMTRYPELRYNRFALYACLASVLGMDRKTIVLDADDAVRYAEGAKIDVYVPAAEEPNGEFFRVMRQRVVAADEYNGWSASQCLVAIMARGESDLLSVEPGSFEAQSYLARTYGVPVGIIEKIYYGVGHGALLPQNTDAALAYAAFELSCSNSITHSHGAEAALIAMRRVIVQQEAASVYRG